MPLIIQGFAFGKYFEPAYVGRVYRRETHCLKCNPIDDFHLEFGFEFTSWAMQCL